ncbi:GspMb/PilO family protein [Azospirillum sp. B4]|uniref:GspMb/PilO family protein n=1 Tax=Azospirillum sp. B4 TaxID=95605 RepID=UPI000345DD3C|nr:GspMb/PilO family protein [Azospirillum sp. B4]
MMTAPRPGFILAIALCLLALPPCFYLPSLVDAVEAAAARRVARLTQLEAARTLLAQHDDLDRRAALFDRALGVHTLLRTGPDMAAVQAAAEDDVRQALRQAGVTVRDLAAAVAAGRGPYRRIHLTVRAEGDAVSVTNAVAALDAVRPRLLLRGVRIHADAPPAAAGPSGPSFGRAQHGGLPADAASAPATLELEIDVYADLAAP